MNRAATYVVVLAGTIGLMAAGCVPVPCTTDTVLNVAQGLQAECVAAGLPEVAAMAFAPDGRVFFVEKDTGRIRVIEEGELVDEPFATLAVNNVKDRGLLGIAVHPDFHINNRVYVFYTRSDTGQVSDDPRAVIDHRVVYFVADGNVASGGEVFVASVPNDGEGGRVGGRIAFASDNTLYVALGDMTNVDAAQDTTVYGGKVLRFNDDGSIPGGNPIAGSPVYARGFRHPRGITVDPDSGVLFVTDRSGEAYHEINRVEEGRDYGWPTVVGLADTTVEQAYAAGNADYVDPIVESGLSSGVYVGGAFNTGTKYGPSLWQDYFYGIAGTGEVYRLQLSDDRGSAVSTSRFGAGFPTPIVTLGFTESGTLYVACENEILRVQVFDAISQ